MPTYSYRCECGKTEDRYTKVNERDNPVACGCGKNMKRLITTNYHLQTDYASADYVTHDITGEGMRITSRRQEKELCEKYGVYRKEGKPRNETRDKRMNNKLSRWI